MSKINTQKIVSIISSVIPSYYPIKEVSLLLYSKKLKSFCRCLCNYYSTNRKRKTGNLHKQSS